MDETDILGYCIEVADYATSIIATDEPKVLHWNLTMMDVYYQEVRDYSAEQEPDA